MSDTGIEWADRSSNGAAGCSKARFKDGKMDPGCLNCYAELQSARMPGLMRGGVSSERKERIAKLYDGVSTRAGRGAMWSGTLRWDPELLTEAFEALRPTKTTFLGSMTDMWHPKHDPALLERLALLIDGAPPERQARGLITLTKRIDLLIAWQQRHFPRGLPPWVWPGASMGTQDAVNERLWVLAQVNARVRVISAEPLLGPLDFGTALTDPFSAGEWWLIGGDESGTRRRPTERDWHRGVRDQAVAARVPYFLKQMDVNGEVVGTPELDGRTWTEIP